MKHAISSYESKATAIHNTIVDDIRAALESHACQTSWREKFSEDGGSDEIFRARIVYKDGRDLALRVCGKETAEGSVASYSGTAVEKYGDENYIIPLAADVAEEVFHAIKDSIISRMFENLSAERKAEIMENLSAAKRRAALGAAGIRQKFKVMVNPERGS